MLTPDSYLPAALRPRAQKIILIASIIISICAIVGFALSQHANHIYHELIMGNTKSFPKYYSIMLYCAYVLKPFTYDISRTYWTRIFSDWLSFLDFLPVIILLLHLLGLVFFAVKKNAGIRLLRFVYATWFIFRVFALIEFLIYQAMLPVKLQYTEINREPWYQFLFVILVHITWIWLCAWLLTRLKSFTRIKLEGEGDTAVFIPSNRWMRFLHMLIDGWLIIFILFQFIGGFLWLVHEKIGSGASVSALKFFIYLTAFVMQLIYYVLFEGIWGLTPAKCLTGSLVVNDKGQKADWSKIMSRSLSRFIPFDNFSFLSWRGWHDRLSDTWVCKEENAEEPV